MKRKPVVGASLTRLRAVFVCAGVLLSLSPTSPARAEVEASSDQALRQAIQSIQLGASLDQALNAARQASQSLPKSNLAHFLQFQAYTSMAGGDPTVAPPTVKANPEATRELVNEARARAKLVSVPAGSLPAAIVQLAPATDTVLLVESDRSRVWVLARRSDRVEVIASHYVTVGQQGVGKEREGDRRTPLGVYRIQNEIAGAKLTDFYGPYALPLDYPNTLDRARAKTGSGIWVHGVPSDRYARPPLASDGCVVLANEDLLALRKYAKPGRTTVLVVPQTTWLSPTAWRKMAADQLAALPQDGFQKTSSNGEPTRYSVYHLEAEQLMAVERIDRRGQPIREYWKRDSGRWVPYLEANSAALH